MNHMDGVLELLPSAYRQVRDCSTPFQRHTPFGASKILEEIEKEKTKETI